MRYLLLSAFFFIPLNANAQAPVFDKGATIYLVRHAEKLSGTDPLLTAEGNKRAGDLMRALQNKKIKRIYLTEYKRTQNTADSLRIQWGIDTVHYLSDTSCTDLFGKIKAHNDRGNTILIIGHSNTIPIIIRKLGVAGYPAAEIPANEFDNLFVVDFTKGHPVLKRLKFGALSGASATMH